MPKAARLKNSIEPGKKVGRCSWMTDAQETWLTDHVKVFVNAQGKGITVKKRRFWMISGPECGKDGFHNGQKRHWKVRMAQ